MRRCLLFLCCALPTLAQQPLPVSSSAVLLTDSQARTITIARPPSGPAQYTISGKPAWLNITSANQFKTPDTLYFQLASSSCGDCTATITLNAPAIAPTPITVRFKPVALEETRLALGASAVNLSSTQARSLAVTGPNGISVPYTVSNPPAWLTVTSTNNYKTPDTLYFQLANSSCGDCTVTLSLTPAGSSGATTLPVSYNANAASTYRATNTRVTLTYPAPFGTSCDANAISACKILLSSSKPGAPAYSAKINNAGRDNWLMLNNGTSPLVSGMPVTNGLTVSVNPAVAGALPTGVYRAQVAVYDAARQNDLVMIDVALMLNPGIMTVTPTSGAGNTQTFTLRFPHPGGWQSLSVVNALFNSSLDSKSGCYLGYELATSSLILLNDQGDDAATTFSNSQCAAQLVSAKGDATTLTVVVNLTFRPAFAGPKNIYLAERDRDQNNSGWQPLGAWEIKRPASPPRKLPPKKK